MNPSTPTKKVSRSGGDRSQNIQVFVRVRPLNESEKAIRSCSVLEGVDGKKLVVQEKANSSLTKTFAFNGVFDADVPQGPVYARVVKPLIEQVLLGYNCTVFAYGQTGTGKTHTMEGQTEGQQAGVIPRALSDLFDHLESSRAKDFAVRVSYLELYNEEIFDLLSDVSDTSRLRLFEDSNKKGSVIIQGLEELQVHSKEEVLKILKKGSLKRQTAATLMNANSSRSHTVFTVTVLINQCSTVGDQETIKMGKLNLVDLAGSENVGRSGAMDKRAREAGNINQSLLTLGRVIASLVERTPHVPYRESKLTRLLQDSLGGKTKTSIIATVSPALINLEETLSTLDYAHRAKSITNKPEVNQRICKNEKILEYTNQIDRLKSELQTARDKSGVYLSKDHYVDMVKKDESQDKEIITLIDKIKVLEDEINKINEMFEQTKSHLEQTTKERDTTIKTLESTRTVLCQTETEKEEQEYLVAQHVETEFKLKNQANILLAVSDESTRDLSGVHDKLDRVRSIESHNQKTTEDFHSTFLSRYNRLEESFQSQIMEQSKFCAQTKETLNTLLYERNGHKLQTSEGFTHAMDSIVNLISDLETSLSDNICKEQSWVNSQKLQARNAADGHQKKLQVYLTEKVLPKLASISNAIVDQKSATQETSAQVHSLVSSQVDKWEKYIEDQHKLSSESLELIKEVGISKDKHLKDLEMNQEGLRKANGILEKDFANLLKSVESFSQKMKSHTTDSNQGIDQNMDIIKSIRSEGDKMIFGVEALTDTSLKRSESHMYELSQESSTIRQKQDSLLGSMNTAFDIIVPAEQELSKESKEFVSNIQDDLEKEYSELERSLRLKSDTAADYLKFLNSKTQDIRTSSLNSQRSLEERLEFQRSEDEKNTNLVRESIEKYSKNIDDFGNSYCHQFCESGQSVGHFVSEDLKRDTPTTFTPIRKPPRAYPQKIMAITPDATRLRRFRDMKTTSLLTAEESSIPEDDADSVISVTTVHSEDLNSVDENCKENSAPRTALSRQNSLEKEFSLSKDPIAKSAIPVCSSNFRKPLSSMETRSRSSSRSRNNNNKK